MTDPTIANRFQLNGEPAMLSSSITVADLLAGRGLRVDRVAVEVNGTIVSKPDYTTRIIQPGDVVEVVSFVGGG